jgi:signal transduction histidine kinase
LLAHQATISEQELESHLQIIAHNGRRMQSIIDALLLLARVRKTQVETVPLGATVLPQSSRTPSVVRFWVRDNGQGLAPKEQAKLFTPFTRLRQLQVQGHRLGFSIVQRIVKKLGGEVGVESPPSSLQERGESDPSNQGSLFWFTLPLA